MMDSKPSGEAALLKRPKVAIMQPTFLPWQGYFALIALSDIFVFLDDVQFVRRSMDHRNRLFLNGLEVGWMSIPIRHSGHRVTLNEARISFDHSFLRKFCGRLEANYRRSPGFELMYPILVDWLRRSNQRSLADCNIELIQLLSRQINIFATFARSSEIKSRGTRSEKIYSILRSTGARTYLSAQGSFSYMREDGIFPRDDVEVVFHNFKQIAYPQLQCPKFVSNLSLVDAIFQVGATAAGNLVRSGLRDPIPWSTFAVGHVEAPAGIDSHVQT
jgi:hypothetical protein